MKCFVCGKEYTGGECPRCHFPNVQLPGDYEEGLAAIRDEIKAYRERFFGRCLVGIRTWHWMDVEGELQPVCAEDRYFGQLLQLQEEEQWLSWGFARIPDVPELEITVLMKQGEEVREKTVTVANLIEQQLLEIGAVADDQFRVQILVRNASGTIRKSAPIALIDE